MFYEYCLILNTEKCHYMFLGKTSASDLLRICGEDLEASELKTVLGIPADNSENHIKSLCSKACQKLGILQRISNQLDTQKKPFIRLCNKISVLLLPHLFGYFFQEDQIL